MGLGFGPIWEHMQILHMHQIDVHRTPIWKHMQIMSMAPI